ncbi:FtsB family cell division protein [Clostridium saccharobutylicum]|uniref:Septum formation initiator n=2 Tax=Clostridium saccharobutylicum TaxID=169679 RepID=U5MNC6_CLOSA|nr:septum formation initiator family protein [Clostridium saccharobutylicum]AGX41196.1 septum formation initiator [Clostridium saccharobutylicum DSM 13864]AQR88482.1 cell division protein FtsL [Clostridium saccharobutylicum]AQR98380.1 cell division protein FtsL [Clostridium saccharobutylicum]AQS08091.1 cell division protein FtsL [Clostridium saccharobutylicum]AQS12370.1 cell division protein FtsL [Clostridium saccharobutylicum]
MKNKLMIKKLIIVGFIIFFAFSYIRQRIEINRIEKEIANKQSQLQDVKEKNERLQDEVEKINSDSLDYLEKLARERLGMIKPGEKVVNSSTTESSSN